MQDIGDRLKSYEPLWENWYKDSYIGGGSFSKVYKLKQDFFGSTRYSAVKIIPINLEQKLAVKKSDMEKHIEDTKAVVIEEIKNMYKLEGKPYLVSCSNYAIKDIYDETNKQIGFDVLIHMGYYTPLSKHMKENGELSISKIEMLAQQIGTALKSMHDINMLHRDVKVENIYIDDNGDYLLGDFGVSKQIQSSSYSTLAGTQPFIAPEVWKVQQTSKRYTKTADIYSLGITLYYLLNNNMLPLVDENSSQNDIDGAIYDRLNGKSFPPPENGTKKFKEIVMKCCEYEPDDRYQSMDEILCDLKSLTNQTDDEKETLASEKTVKVDKSKATEKNTYATIYADDEVFKDKKNLQEHEKQNSDNNQSYIGAISKSNKKIIVLFVTLTGIFAALIAVIAIVIEIKSTNGVNLFKNDTPNKYSYVNSKTEQQSDTSTTVDSSRNSETTTTTTPTIMTTTTAHKSVDAVKNNYEELDTTLIVKVDEADTLPLRSTPEKIDNIITRIPDGTQVHVLGYKDMGTEVWFRVEYEIDRGWVRGGMLQPDNLSMINDHKYNLPGLEKWKNKFQLQTPSTTDYSSYSAVFKGTLYFQPDLSSGVQKRFKESTYVNVTAESPDKYWYFVEIDLNGTFYQGWVHTSQLS